LAHPTERPPIQPLQRGDRCSINTKHNADPVWFLAALIYSPIPSVQTPIQLMEPREILLCIFHGAQKPG
jgi:hypothetical protein